MAKSIRLVNVDAIVTSDNTTIDLKDLKATVDSATKLPKADGHSPDASVMLTVDGYYGSNFVSRTLFAGTANSTSHGSMGDNSSAIVSDGSYALSIALNSKIQMHNFISNGVIEYIAQADSLGSGTVYYGVSDGQDAHFLRNNVFYRISFMNKSRYQNFGSDPSGTTVGGGKTAACDGKNLIVNNPFPSTVAGHKDVWQKSLVSADNAYNFGVLSENRYRAYSCSDATNAVFTGGNRMSSSYTWTAPLSSSEYIGFASGSTYQTFATTGVPYSSGGMSSDGDTGLAVGGTSGNSSSSPNMTNYRMNLSSGSTASGGSGYDRIWAGAGCSGA